jgi:O-antigen/teichoic acid export membrane protein
MRERLTTLRSRLLRGTFKRGFVSTFGLNVVARGLSAIAIVLLVRGLEVEDFAYVVLFISVGSFAGSFATGGIRMRYMRQEAERVSRGLEEPSSFLIAVAGSATQILAAAALGLVGATILGVGASAAERLTFVGLVALYSLGHASTELGIYHHQAHLAFAKAGLFGVLRGGSNCVTAVVATVGLISSGPVVALCMALGTLAVAVPVCAPLAWATRRSRHGVEGRFGWGAESNWLTVFFVASAGFWYSSMFLVAALLDDGAVASFGAALRYISFVLGPVSALMAVLRVRTSQHDVVDSHSTQLTMLLRWIRQASLPTAAVVGSAAALAPILIPLIDGGRYPDSVTIFQLLLIDAFFVYLTMPAPNLMMAQRRYRLLALLYLVFLVAQTAATVFAGTVWGVIGIAAVSTAFGVASRVALVGVILWSPAPAARLREPALSVE